MHGVAMKIFGKSSDHGVLHSGLPTFWTSCVVYYSQKYKISETESISILR